MIDMLLSKYSVVVNAPHTGVCGSTLKTARSKFNTTSFLFAEITVYGA